MTQMTPSLCQSCANLRPDGVTCDAFPAGIPDGILLFNDIDHRRPVPGDGGIVWELNRKQKAAYDQWLEFIGEITV
jgi:hypothetical protein